MACRVEAVLQAWADCRPEGGTLPERRLPALLPRIGLHVPGHRATPETAHRLDEFFGASSLRFGRPVPFLQLLKPCDGRVHFLYFWRAFEQATRLGDPGFAEGETQAKPTTLAGELEQLRDDLLPHFECRARLSTGDLATALRERVAASKRREFWRQCECELELSEQIGGGLGGEIDLEDLAALFIPWLLDAVRQPPPARLAQPRHRHKRKLPASPTAAVAQQRPPPPLPVSITAPRADSISGAAPEVRPSRCLPWGPTPHAEGIPVYLNVYDVSHEHSLRLLNKVLAHQRAPVKLGGVFHAGIELAGEEWCYGYAKSSSTGVTHGEPRSNPDHRFRQTIFLGSTRLSPEAVAEVIAALAKEYRGKDYDLLRRNCCHFADELARRLGVRSLPCWVHRLARLGARLDGVLHVTQGLRARAQSAVERERRAAAAGA